MYQISKKGNVYKDGLPIPLDDSTPEWAEYVAHRNSGGEIQHVDEMPDEMAENIARKVDQLKNLQKRELSATDWAVVRKMELGTEIPEDIQCKREEIRTRYNQIIAELTSDINQQYK